MSVTTSPVEFDPLSEKFFNDSERRGSYALSCFADVLSACRDRQRFSNAHGVELFTLSKDPEQTRSHRRRSAWASSNSRSTGRTRQS